MIQQDRWTLGKKCTTTGVINLLEKLFSWVLYFSAGLLACTGSSEPKNLGWMKMKNEWWKYVHVGSEFGFILSCGLNYVLVIKFCSLKLLVF